jgi:2-methylcitrate dehydratase PrpD
MESAAFIGGTAGTWHDLDEGNLHTRNHAAIQIAPALLADAEARSLSGRALIDAFTVAYEVVGRLWRSTNVRLAVHPHGTTGPLAAAVALARLRGDGVDAILGAMNIAMTLGVAASRQALGNGATVRNIYTGNSGRAALEALTLRDIGFTGEIDAPRSILGSIYGDQFDSVMAASDLGVVWWMRKSYFKRFASGRYIHAALDAVEALCDRMEESLSEAAIERINVSTFFMAATMGNQKVDTPFGLRFSIPAAIATRIILGPQRLTGDGHEVFADARVHALAGRVFVDEDADATAAYPGRQPTTITVKLHDGRTETASVERILGESDHPLADMTLRRKFVELALPKLGETDAGSAFDALTRLDECQDVSALIGDMRKAVIRHAELGH